MTGFLIGSILCIAALLMVLCMIKGAQADLRRQMEADEAAFRKDMIYESFSIEPKNRPTAEALKAVKGDNRE